MKLSRKTTGLAIVMVAILSISLISAGCIGSVNLFPGEVNNHGNTIYIDSDYVDSATITEMLLNPESYEREFFAMLDKHLPKNTPVIDIGVGTGAAMAYISNKLHVPKQQIAVEPNPYLIPSLKKTIDKNGLVVTLRQEAIAYTDASSVPFTVSKDLSSSMISPSETTETVNVPVTTVADLIDGSTFSGNTNISLIVETSDLIETIFSNEVDLNDRVKLIIANMPELKDYERPSFINLATNAGYVLEDVSNSSETGVVTYVFSRIQHEVTSQDILNEALTNVEVLNETPVNVTEF